MAFKDFINSLSPDEKENFTDYSEIRGVQQYKIIYETLNKINPNVTYSDVNAFVIFDKALKDILFKYLGTLEEMIRNDLIIRYDFAPDINYKNEEYHYFKQLPNCVSKKQRPDGITDFYKYFALNFGDMISFIEEYDKEIQKYDIQKLKVILKLRNNVMHHSPLLFNYNYESTVNDAIDKIKVLIELLPERYMTGEKGIINALKKTNNATKKNINKTYYDCLLFKEA